MAAGKNGAAKTREGPKRPVLTGRVTKASQTPKQGTLQYWRLCPFISAYIFYCTDFALLWLLF